MNIQEYFNLNFKDKKLLILGLGREGESSLKLLNKYLPDQKVDTADIKNGKDYLNSLTNYDIVIKSPGIPNKLLEIKNAIKNGVTFTSQTEIFFDQVRGKVIGVTGTKGKSTTTSLIYHILKSVGKNVYLVGNLGLPVLDYLDKDSSNTIYCFELSSHQLSTLRRSPDIAVLLNIYPEHLDYYNDYQDYFSAKSNITKYQTKNDVFIYNSNFELINELSKSVISKTIDFIKLELPETKSKLLGEHNLNNIKASWAVALELGLSLEDIKKGIESFKPLEDRLELVNSVNRVDFVNDTLATIPEAAISAVESFEKSDNITLILGGYDRGIDFSILGNYLRGRKNVKNIILIGQSSTRIKECLNGYMGIIHELGSANMDAIVKLAYKVTRPKGMVLLSPAATSFDMFKDYKDRANQFKEAINKLK